ncbi:membrane-bound transcription factor site-1 protease [Marchantia polymorpha subsp. ruderalis]|uniref:Uncharacterized protein n=1 Tax=Marchantia polymorpha TaxID=3197 RepID=A0A2R6W4H1_MARPO|nr:hypothetical protein MARPO_0155s0018 [Marchantia polymorpha]BBN19114.1 hypothetical protein Mp_8g07990 [Marchantia polymorpha subsp. ruderalis]|eukprot:PTQ28756.1 hypothetical protein MARPO_0155s0018 [Marchantia polymorpha]
MRRAQAVGVGSWHHQLLVLLLLLLPILACDDLCDQFGLCSKSNASTCSRNPVPPWSKDILHRRCGASCPEKFFPVDQITCHMHEAGTSRRESADPPSDTRNEAGLSEDIEQEENLRVIGEVANEYIVRFREYQDALAHRRALEQAVGAEGWEWVDRNNPASAFPTDFGLLRIPDSQREPVLSRLSGASIVRDVSHQMKFTRGLASESETDTQKPTSASKLTSSKGSRKSGRETSTIGDSAGPSKTGKMDVTSDLKDRVDELYHTEKPPGRLKTGLSIEDEMPANWKLGSENISLADHSRRLLLQRSQITSMFEAERLWAKGHTGSKVKMAVFDTGVRSDHPHFRNIKERTNWTNEKDTLNDNLGHGTFVAGVISSQDPQCLGFAPDAEIYAFRVFTDAQVSYTSWFLDAFNYAIATKMNVLNLSIGGPDYLDSPFVEKVWEMTANNIIMVSAIGNDGPLYGTLNNPADQSDVIGVGGIDYSDHIASFSSRGMSTWEIPHGYGRVKPDIVAYGREVIGSKITTGCKSLSGTSVASPVVAGAVCLLASVVPEDKRWDILNPASMKQALVEGATRLVGPNMYEQGAGRLNLLKSYEILTNYSPRTSIHPKTLDLTDCPYAWPFCRQPMYAGAMPVIFNATILNGMGVVGYLESAPKWTPFGSAGHLLDIQFTYSDVIWPWTGYLGLHLRIKPEGNRHLGILEGNITFTVVSPPAKGEYESRRCECSLPLKVAVVPTPAREKRILWDQFHSVRYPPGYIPRDSLDVRNDILDWHGDHLHTNFHGMFDSLRDAGYFLESLGSPLTCFDANQYGTLLMVDLEDEYYEEEIEKLKDDVQRRGLGLIVFADWYHVDTMVKMRFFDDNTRSWWTPATGGANIPALNDLLSPFGIAFGDTILNGAFSIGGERAHYASGTDIKRFPAGGFVHRFLFQDSSGANSGITSSRTSVKAQVESAILGAVEAGRGRIAVYGDSNCLDSSHMVTNCYWLLKKLLDFTSYRIRDPILLPLTNELLVPIGSPDTLLPSRRTDVNFTTYSLVLGHRLQCGMDAPLVVQGSKGFLAQPETVMPARLGDPNVTPGSTSLPQRQPMTSSQRGPATPSLSNAGDGNFSVISSTVDGDIGSETPPIHRTPDSKNGNHVQLEGNVLNSTDSDVKTSEPHSEKTSGELSRERENYDGSILTMKAAGESNKGRMGFGIGWRRDELDSTALVVQWLVPFFLCFTGFVLIWSLWRVRQRKRRRAKKGSARSLLFL